MPWCGFWGTAGSAFWWVPPLIVVVLMGAIFFLCSRALGFTERRRHAGDGFSDVQRRIQELQDDVGELLRPPR